MDNYRAWFKRETDTFKETYCTQVDNYFDLVLRQIEAIICRTGDESTQELSEMMRHMEDTNTLYQQQLTWLSRRYFDSKPAFDAISSAVNDTTSVTNPITPSDPNTGDSYQVNAFSECSTYQPQLANIGKRSDANVGMPKYSDDDFLCLDSTLSEFVSLLPSNHNIGSQSTVPSPSVTSMAPVEQQQNAVFMGQSDTNSGSKLNSAQLTSDMEAAKGESSVGGQGNEMKETKLVEMKAHAQQPPEPASLGAFKRTLASPVPTGSPDAKRARGVPVKRHTCLTCGKSFMKNAHLERHIRSHTQERPFACDQCERTFARKDHLTIHLRSHSGTMKGRCTWPGCTYQTAKSSNVLMHIRGVHFNLPPTKKMQSQLDIVDDRNPYDYYQKI